LFCAEIFFGSLESDNRYYSKAVNMGAARCLPRGADRKFAYKLMVKLYEYFHGTPQNIQDTRITSTKINKQFVLLRFGKYFLPVSVLMLDTYLHCIKQKKPFLLRLSS
jgi:hypothetical protein